MLDYQYYWDVYHQPIELYLPENSDPVELTINVRYEWLGSPFKEYTLKAYSKYDSKILDTIGNSNQVYMNGESPSGFTESTYQGMENNYCSSLTFSNYAKGSS
jgi:hypothetical protein